MSKFRGTGSLKGGSDSDTICKNPSKPSLIFVTTLVNKYKVKLLIDTGASATFINERVLRYMTLPQAIQQTPYSFTLADGIAPFHVLGVIELSIEFSNSTTKIQAHVAKQLCADMIIGMDYINKYNLNIDIMQQTISIANDKRIFTMNIDQDYTIRRIPVTTSKSILIPAHSKRSTNVIIPISSICSSFVPASHLQYTISLSTMYTFLQFQNYCSSIKFLNTSSDSRWLNKGTCIGFLFCSSTTRPLPLFLSSSSNLFDVAGSPGSTSVFRNLSVSQPVDDKSFGVVGNTGLTPVLKQLVITGSPGCKLSSSDKFSVRDDSTLISQNTGSYCNTIQPINPIVAGHIRKLVEKIEDKQQQETISVLLLRYQSTFDITKHNIANTPIQHVINTVPHSAPACRPYPQPDKEEAMYKLIQEFLKAIRSRVHVGDLRSILTQ